MPPNIVKIGKFRFRQKVAVFDYDWTLVRPKSNGIFSKGLDDWIWLTKNVPDVLRGFYNKGYCIMVISNQTRNTKMKTEQIVQVMSTLSDIPSVIAVGFEEGDKKPNRTMFDILVGDKKLDLEKSVFVGDALGRSDDWSDTDKQFAIAIGIKNIFAPDDVFAVQREEKKMVQESSMQEIIVMVGYAGSGKSTIASQFYEQRYKVIAGDDYGDSKKMIKAGVQWIEKGFSVIFDATNPTIEKRKEYIDVGAKYNLPVRCIVMKTDMTESMFRNNKRDKVIPKITYYVFRKKYVEPSVQEGFVDVISIS